MRKLLTAGIFGTILSLTGANYAGASIISRGFFDEAMENYATNTALDLKANQSDLTALSNKIGTLPGGNLPAYPKLEVLFSELNQPLTYPISLAELINAIYGNSETDSRGLLDAIITGFAYDDTNNDGSPDQPVGLISNYYLAKKAYDKIGDLPSGDFPGFPFHENLFPELNQPFTYPTSLAELINAIYGNLETGTRGLLEGIIHGFPYDDTDGDGSMEQYAGLIPNYNLARLASDLARSANAKIGTLPPGYDNVGAALGAMKSDIDAKNLPSTSDDGQYVLTAKKVGNTITYTWVKMDLTSEEQAQ